MNTYLNSSYTDLKKTAQKKTEYKNAEPYPNILFEDFFNPTFLNEVLNEFPDLLKGKQIHYNNPNELKLASIGSEKFGNKTNELFYFLNSQPFLEFLQELTGIKETLMPDPYFEGAGYHEVKPGGFLKIHSDFNKHIKTQLDRRLNLLVYLNKDWEESYGGHFELWGKDMRECKKKILPEFNQVVLFSTTDFSYHGHPSPLNCPANRSRKSLAIYYYTNGRPGSEIDPSRKDHPALFLARNTEEDKKMNLYNFLVNGFTDYLVPPFIVRFCRKIIVNWQKK